MYCDSVGSLLNPGIMTFLGIPGWAQMVPEALQSSLDLIEDEVSGMDSAWSNSDSEGT